MCPFVSPVLSSPLGLTGQRPITGDVSQQQRGAKDNLIPNQSSVCKEICTFQIAERKGTFQFSTIIHMTAADPV